MIPIALQRTESCNVPKVARPECIADSVNTPRSVLLATIAAELKSVVKRSNVARTDGIIT